MRAFLIAAAAVAVAAPAFAAVDGRLVDAAGFQGPRSIFAKACTRLGVQVAQDRPVAFKTLADLPPSVLEHAVYRMVDGCPVREVRWRGQTVYVAPQASESLPTLDRRPLAYPTPGAVKPAP